MKKNTPVSKIMTADPISVNLDNSVMDVATIFDEKNIHHIPVVSKGDLVGMVSQSDLDRISFVSDFQTDKEYSTLFGTLTLNQIMTKQVETVQANDPVKIAAELLAKNRYHALPVLENGELKGIITSTDVINFLLDQL